MDSQGKEERKWVKNEAHLVDHNETILHGYSVETMNKLDTSWVSYSAYNVYVIEDSICKIANGVQSFLPCVVNRLPIGSIYEIHDMLFKFSKKYPFVLIV